MQARKKCIHPVFLVLFILIFVSPVITHAAVPSTINYQGYLTDTTGVPVDGTVNITFRLYDHETEILPVNLKWDSGPVSVDVSNGVYSVILGEAPLSPIDPAIFASQLWLAIAVGSDNEMTPRQKLTSIPYSIRTGSVDWSGINNVPDDIANGDDVGITIENDPEVGILTAGQWCTSDGTTINCTQSPPVVAETDPTVNALAKAGLNCAENEVAKFIGGNWTCSSDTDTNVTSLDGLAGGTINGDLSVTGNTILGNTSGDTINVVGTTHFESSVVADLSPSENVTLNISSTSTFSSRALQINTTIISPEGLNSGMRITNTSGSVEVLDAGIVIEDYNSLNGISDGILFQGSGADSIVDAIDASHFSVYNALNIGSNNIAGTNFSVNGASGTITASGLDTGGLVLSGNGLSGANSVTIDLNNAADTAVLMTNSGPGTANLTVEGTISASSLSSAAIDLNTTPSVISGRISYDTAGGRIGVGNGATTDYFYPGAHTVDTNAGTICLSGDYLDGDGTCKQVNSHNHFGHTWSGSLAGSGLSINNSYTGGASRGIYASVTSAAATNEAGHFEVTGSNPANAVAVYGRSRPDNNYGIGGSFEGGRQGVYALSYAEAVHAEAQSSDGSSPVGGNFIAFNTSSLTSGNSFGVYGFGYGGVNAYGVYGSASGGTNNYAGYFDGDVRITGDLKADRNRISFYTGKTSTQSTITPGSTTVVDFQSTRLNDGNAFDLTTDTFTAPYDGVYEFSTQLRVYWLEAGKSAVVTLYKNGFQDVWIDSVIGVAGSGSEYHGLGGTVTLPLVAGDQIEVRIFNGNVTWNLYVYGFGTQYSYFSGHRVY